MLISKQGLVGPSLTPFSDKMPGHAKKHCYLRQTVLCHLKPDSVSLGHDETTFLVQTRQAAILKSLRTSRCAELHLLSEMLLHAVYEAPVLGNENLWWRLHRGRHTVRMKKAKQLSSFANCVMPFETCARWHPTMKNNYKATLASCFKLFKCLRSALGNFLSADKLTCPRTAFLTAGQSSWLSGGIREIPRMRCHFACVTWK